MRRSMALTRLHKNELARSSTFSCRCRGTAGRSRLVVHAKLRDFQREVVVGIDLGTTNSAVACIEGGKPKCIPNADGETITPSVVSVLKDGEVLVGRRAVRQAVLNPGTTYYSVKRIIGRAYDDPAVQEEAARLAYKLGNGTVEVLSTGGDAHLGGDDWDAAVAGWVERNYLRPAGLEPATDPRLRANLRALAQAAKHSLSAAEEVVLR
ncbi:hypothetical protein GPECTOR_39g498 [Gonium pectorale]|uniref:HSP70 protein n=1 Tax=Gonium pectorale TaxID=33097 RepID=A0A150GB08_GONPE|nr:hypothetical protein GPECTOR_39g498 [Gonium pectorale]|eukprot:KXZ47004.1 hypothetical protein GPECTOR_39g498 [Gonium pectorale]